MERRLLRAAALACLVPLSAVSAAAASGGTTPDPYDDPDLAEIFSDPQADGYDRTFSMCQVEAKDFQATVRSTAYRVLKGVCNPDELESHLAAMEGRLNQKIDELKETLISLLRGTNGDDRLQNANSATNGPQTHYNIKGGASSHTALESEKNKHYQDSMVRKNYELAKYGVPQNDLWPSSQSKASDQRRLAVQNLLSRESGAQPVPGPPQWPSNGRHGKRADTGHVARQDASQSGAKQRSAAAEWARKWQGNSLSSTMPPQYPASFASKAASAPSSRSNFQSRGSTGGRQNAVERRNHDQSSKPSWANSSPRSHSPRAATRRQDGHAKSGHVGRGRHVTDTISYVSPTESAPASRYSELSTYNDTVYFMNGKRMYSYYWKIKDFHAKMSSWEPSRSLRSPSFYVYHGGYRMFLRVYPRHRRHSVLVRVGIAEGRYDSTLRWPFRLPLRLSLLDHSARPVDMQSRRWRPVREACPGRAWQRPPPGRRRHQSRPCLGLSVPHRLLARRRALLHDTLLVKLDVFLDGDGDGDK